MPSRSAVAIMNVDSSFPSEHLALEEHPNKEVKDKCMRTTQKPDHKEAESGHASLREKKKKGRMTEERDGERVCVTGAGGYVASWLVKLLLSKGFVVHGTVRDPCDEKNNHLKNLENASENLKLFKAELLEFESLFAAIDGCCGVFHVASAVPSARVANPQVELLEPAITGTRNVISACEKGKVKKLVVVSSAGAVYGNPNWPKHLAKDEDCWSDPEFCRMNQDFYGLAKTLAETEALEHGKQSDQLNVATICPPLVIGPMLQSTLNASNLAFLKYIQDGPRFYPSNDRPLVDVRDLAEAIFLVYDKPKAKGRYICSSYTVLVRELIERVKSIYPNYNYRQSDADTLEENWRLSSKKLESLGWKYRPLEETLVDALNDLQEKGFLVKH